MTPAHGWQKSSYSGDSSNCLYIAAGREHTLKLRESDEPEVILAPTPQALRTFLAAIKTGELSEFLAL